MAWLYNGAAAGDGASTATMAKRYAAYRCFIAGSALRAALQTRRRMNDKPGGMGNVRRDLW